MHQRLPHHRLPAATHLRAGLRASVLALLAMFWLLAPQWHGGTATAAAMQATSTQTGGEEIPARESAEQEAPAKLRRAAPLQAARAAASRPAPALPPAHIAGTTTLIRSTLPAIPPACCPTAAPLCWRLQRGQAPPLA